MHRTDSVYDDRPEVQYQFPKLYLSRATEFIGDWIIYYEPRRGPTSRGYFAAARVERISPDPSNVEMYLAHIEPGSYLPFEQDVPFSGFDGVVEQGLLNEKGELSGRVRAAVRPVTLADFNRILDFGFPDEVSLLPRRGDPQASPKDIVADAHQAGTPDQERQRVSYYSSRIIRDRVFRRVVLDAYDRRCAITGLKLINGGGRAEVEAAHIKAVEANGPDIITNGLALSGTAHWMFDRGLIALTDNLEVLVSRQVNDIESVWGLVNPTRRAIVPTNEAMRPHPTYLAWHRTACFKA